MVIGLTACGDKGANAGNIGSKDIAMGRYMEENMELPKFEEGESIAAMALDENNELMLYAATIREKEPLKISIYKKKDGSWKAETPEFLNQWGDEEIVESNFIQGKDGLLYLSNSIMKKNNVTSKLYKILEDRTGIEDVTPISWGKEIKSEMGSFTMIPGKINILKNGSIVYQNEMEQSIWLCKSPKDDEDQQVDLMVAAGNKTVVFENQIIAVNQSKDKVIFYDTETNSIAREVAFENKNSASMYSAILLEVLEDGTLYLADNGGLHKLTKDSTLWETQVEGSLNTMSMPSAALNDMIVLKSDKMEEYFVSYYVDGLEIKRYFYDETVASVPERKLTIYALEDNNTLRQAISNFHREHTDVQINYIVAGGEESGVTMADNIRALNTELLEGNGADILILDGLPIDSYIEKGVLMDLSSNFSAMEEKGELLDNIVDSYKKDGLLYSLPIRFQVPLVYGKEEVRKAANSLAELETYAAGLKGKELFRQGRSNHMHMMLSAYYDELLNAEGKLDKEELVAFLNRVSKIAPKEEDDNSSSFITSFMITEGNMMGSSGSNAKIFEGNVSDLSRDAEAVFYQARNISEMLMDFATLDALKSGFEPIKNYFMPVAKIGVNNASKEKELAAQFLMTLFSEEVQKINCGDGFPINKKAFETWEKEEQDLVMATSSASIEGEEEIEPIEAKWPSKEKRTEFMNVLRGLSNELDHDRIIIQMILSETEAFMKGEDTAENAAESIVKKVNTYMAEQQFADHLRKQ